MHIAPEVDLPTEPVEGLAHSVIFELNRVQVRADDGGWENVGWRLTTSRLTVTLGEQATRDEMWQTADDGPPSYVRAWRGGRVCVWWWGS